MEPAYGVYDESEFSNEKGRTNLATILTLGIGLTAITGIILLANHFGSKIPSIQSIVQYLPHYK